MRFTQVSYQRTFNLGVGTYESEKLGVEIEILEGESPKDALDAAKQLVEEQHKENNKNRYNPLDVPSPITVPPPDEIPVKFITKKENTITPILEEIERCTTMTELEGCWLMSKSNLTLSSAYKEKEKQLKNAK